MKRRLRFAFLASLFLLSMATGCRSHNYDAWHPAESNFKIQGEWIALSLNDDQSPEDAFIEWVEDDKKSSLPKSLAALQPNPIPNDSTTERTATIPEIAELINERGSFDVYREFAISAAAYSGSADQVAKINEAKRQCMYQDEFKVLKAAKRNPLFGVALSGGGVRSASFSQGVLQGLHEMELLREVGYLSTVSGGGYTGGWYITHANGNDKELFKPGSRHLYHLAQYGNFLASGNASGSVGEYVLNVGAHFLFLPIHIPINVLVDGDQNIRQLRDFYRNGIANTYLYGKPYSRDGEEIEPRSMSAWAPNENRPFWIVNANLSLIDDSSHHKNRVGDNFEITPNKCGANAVGYVKTVDQSLYNKELIFDDTFWMGESYAIAASGAAVDSKGLATNAAYTYALDLLNFNLGYFIPGWAPTWVDWKNSEHPCWKRALCQFCHWITTPLPVIAINKQSHARTSQTRRFYITDGGHLENLGLYALIRRGCRLIVVSDSSRDNYNNRWAALTDNEKGKAFDDLRQFEMLLYSDFGAKLEIDWKKITGEKGFAFVGTIPLLPIWPKNAASPMNNVKIIYLKAAFSDSNPPLNSTSFINAEKAHNPDFANASTADVNFSERQVVSQRELGRALVKSMEKEIRANMPPDSSRVCYPQFTLWLAQLTLNHAAASTYRRVRSCYY